MAQVHIKAKDREAVLVEFNHACAGCGLSEITLEMDHVQPVTFFQARKMPVDNTPKNLQPLCSMCNKAKGEVFGMKRRTPQIPTYDTREAKARREEWFQVVEAAKAADPWHAPLF